MSENTDKNAKVWSDDPKSHLIELSRFEGHTPGPWYWEDITLLSGDPRERNVVLEGADELGESEADLRLIAAAPYLLAAYKQKAVLVDALWDLIDHFNPPLLHEATKQLTFLSNWLQGCRRHYEETSAKVSPNSPGNRGLSPQSCLNW